MYSNRERMCELVQAVEPWVPAVWGCYTTSETISPYFFITNRIIMPRYYLNLSEMIHNHSLLLHNTNI